ncbi:hypothetical protein HJC23_005511 [Cyclotella cryptica]|uniref:PH domain-containing protein n=1 Tax=Cyclotella cryptica TaxID=29204 RepID=A0ABD3NUN4_9STRA|eukprot:CCRYP_020275-RB/>CCRYP_020275-RB protein AED:0.19 eAED:0.19 QI:2372/1/1/1/0.25/0.2/5/2667/520
MSNLSELSIQLRKLQTENNTKNSEIDRLNRQVRILSDLQGISVHDLKDALKTACEGEAHNELRAEVGRLKAQLECFGAAGGRSNVGRGAKLGEGGDSNIGGGMQVKSQEEFRQEAASRARTNLELRVGELEELEGTLRAELAKVYEQARQLASRNTILETQHLQQQNLISDWERRWADREAEDIRKGSIVAKTPSIGSYNYSEFATGCETTNSVPQPTMLLHNVPQSQLDIQQSLLAVETALAGEKQQRSLLQQQIESAQKSNELKLDQYQHRIQFQESQILDLEQQLSSLYAAFGIVQQERTEERDQKLWLKRNLLESDAALAKEAEDKEKGSFFHVTNISRPTVKTSQTPTIAEGYLLLVLSEDEHWSPPFSKSTSTRQSPFSPRKLLSKSKSTPNKISSTPSSTAPKYKRQYCVLHGSNGLYQLRFGNALLDPVDGVHEFITSGVSSVEHTPRSATKNFGFEIKINPEDVGSPSLCCAAETEEDFMMWMTALTAVIDGSSDNFIDHVPPPEAFRSTV